MERLIQHEPRRGRAAVPLLLVTVAAVGVAAIATLWAFWRPEPPTEARFVVDDPIVHIPKAGLIADVAIQENEDVVRLVGAYQRGGVTAVAIRGAAPELAQALSRARGEFARRVVIGAAGVHTAREARDALRVGAEFVLMPGTDAEAIGICREGRVPAIPGAFTATEVAQAWSHRTGLVTLFPAAGAGPAYLRALLREMPDIALVAAGGITPENAEEFIRAGAVAVVAGDEGVAGEPRDHDAVTRRARAFVAAIDRARLRPIRPAPPARPIEGPDIR